VRIGIAIAMEANTPRERKKFQQFVAESSGEFNRRRGASGEKQGKSKSKGAKAGTGTKAAAEAKDSKGGEYYYHQLKQNPVFKNGGTLYKVVSGKLDPKSNAWVNITRHIYALDSYS
jgi:ribosomal 30S subunit maturation factor RimM